MIKEFKASVIFSLSIKCVKTLVFSQFAGGSSEVETYGLQKQWERSAYDGNSKQSSFVKKIKILHGQLTLKHMTINTGSSS
ncbi:hypothetical protein V5799_003521 [Amblyomma americanum]|uniref:Uncharacterized protein n=1 Tax=Amblyomma americanum TaxID=6943 RepID=A0AAQ4D8Q7_AMBAM